MVPVGDAVFVAAVPVAVVAAVLRQVARSRPGVPGIPGRVGAVGKASGWKAETPGLGCDCQGGGLKISHLQKNTIVCTLEP